VLGTSVELSVLCERQGELVVAINLDVLGALCVPSQFLEYLS
jgi:hypothetical protein